MSVSEAVREVLSREENVRGACPLCGEKVLSTCYWIKGRGYVLVWECEGNLSQTPTCEFRRIL